MPMNALVGDCLTSPRVDEILDADNRTIYVSAFGDWERNLTQ